MRKQLKVIVILLLAALLAGCGGEKKLPGITIPGKDKTDPAGPTPDNPGTPDVSDDATTVKVGEVLPAWQEGYLDIHSINTGRGESFFYIFPDGTTMLIDAGGALPNEDHDYGEGNSPGVPSKPSKNIATADVILHYIQHYSPAVSEGALDYMMVSHYHGDHFGTANTYWPKHPSGGFTMNSVTAVGANLKVGKLLDRGEFDDPPSSDWFSGTTNYDNYVKFAKWAATAQGTVREKVRVGANDQIVMKHDPAVTNAFEVRNLAAGGYVWTGTGSESATKLPSTAELKKMGKSDGGQCGENVMSVSLHVRLGAFDWFTGGDSQYNGRSSYPYKDIEAPIAKVMRKVEAMKANHHCTANTNSPELLSVLRPDVLVAAAWRDVQPRAETMNRFITANSNVRIFATNLTDNNRQTLASQGFDVNRMSCTSGHVVIRVHPSGAKYWVFVLNDDNEEYKVSKIIGPLTCQ